ncbi:MAG: glycoside hydrolase, partial [Candidatus Rokuibacteriota bacterium]
MISTIDRDPRGGAAHARLEIGPTLAPGSRRRVCVVSETYPPEINGVAMTLARLVDGLRGRGHAVSVVRPRQRVDRCGPPRDAEEFLVHGAPLPGYGGLQIGLPAAGALRRHWTRHRPDVVYVATEGPLGWSAVRAATRLRLPVVSGFHTN